MTDLDTRPATVGNGATWTAGPQQRAPRWPRVFAAGLALWVGTVLVTFATRNSNLIPAVILLGSFLVPVTFVTYAFARADRVVTAQRVFTAFVVGGLLGVLGASIVEDALLRQPSGLAYAGVGLIEEGVKLAALWLLARRLPYYSARDGMVLGAAVGFGFAAFESAGYAFNAMFTAHGLSLFDLVETEALRGVLTPLGHGLWTAVLGGALFAVAARRGRPRPSGSVLGWYLVVAALHAIWDAAESIAVLVTLLLTGTTSQWLQIQSGQNPAVTGTQTRLATVGTWAVMALDGLLGLLLLFYRWRRTAPRTTARTGGRS
jgi:RsiW-degrading membrane proteinase PrsW (M82 family)